MWNLDFHKQHLFSITVLIVKHKKQEMAKL